MTSAIVNAMSVDIEDYFQVGAFETCLSRDKWDDMPSRVVANSEAVLDLFAECGVHATFFTLGWVAERHPSLIRRIVAEGHELASHGYAHERVHDLDRAGFRENLRRTRACLEDISGTAVRGYRAPSFSIGKRNAWALELLMEEGYAYSSSVAPFASDHYGWPGFPRFAHRPIAHHDFFEVPVSTVKIGKRLLAAGGGGYFRLLPYAFSRWAIHRINEQDRQASVFYFHPWEIDPGQPHIPNAPLKSRLRHYTNLSRMKDKLRRVLQDFRWDRFDRVFTPEKIG